MTHGHIAPPAIRSKAPPLQVPTDFAAAQYMEAVALIRSANTAFLAIATRSDHETPCDFPGLAWLAGEALKRFEHLDALSDYLRVAEIELKGGAR
ncbi:MAG: hypothetical protein ABR606_17955 [Vicinamibacterales bacterium]